MIKAVIFDFDHTLYDREQSIKKAVPALMEGLKPYLRPLITEEEFTKALLQAESAEEGYYAAGYTGVCDVLDKLGVFTCKPEKTAYTDVFQPVFAPAITLFPDTYDTLKTLRRMGYKVALLTNGFTAIQTRKISFTRVAEYMDEMLISEQLGRHKPHPLPFMTICQRLGVRTDEAVYVGDNVICDICGARGAGLIPIWKPFVRRWPKEMAPPPFIIDNLSEIPEILEQL